MKPTPEAYYLPGKKQAMQHVVPVVGPTNQKSNSLFNSYYDQETGEPYVIVNTNGGYQEMGVADQNQSYMAKICNKEYRGQIGYDYNFSTFISNCKNHLTISRQLKYCMNSFNIFSEFEIVIPPSKSKSINLIPKKKFCYCLILMKL